MTSDERTGTETRPQVSGDGENERCCPYAPAAPPHEGERWWHYAYRWT